VRRCFSTGCTREWTALRKCRRPHPIWTNDDLKYNGHGHPACFVSAERDVLVRRGAMRVCTAAGTDTRETVVKGSTAVGIDGTPRISSSAACGGIRPPARCCCIVGMLADGTIEPELRRGHWGLRRERDVTRRARPLRARRTVVRRHRGSRCQRHRAEPKLLDEHALKFKRHRPLGLLRVPPPSATIEARRPCASAPDGGIGGQPVQRDACGSDANTARPSSSRLRWQYVSGAAVLCPTRSARCSVEQVFANGHGRLRRLRGVRERANTLAIPVTSRTRPRSGRQSRTAVPAHDYWTDDSLSGERNLPHARVQVGRQHQLQRAPMRVCTPGGTDSEGKHVPLGSTADSTRKRKKRESEEDE